MKTIKTFAFAILAMVLCSLTFSFTSCTKEDFAPRTEKVVSYCFQVTFTGDAEFGQYSERSDIRKTYLSRLCMGGDSPSVSWTVSKNSLKDAQNEVLAKCKAAEAALANKTFTGTFKVVVTSDSDNKGSYAGATEIYSKTFGPANK